MKKHIDRLKLEWLLGELAELREQDVVDEASARKIRDYYAAVDEQPARYGQKPEETRPAKQNKQQYVLYALVLLGAFLVGLGVILLFAHNWDMLAVYQRVAVAFIPVIIGASCGVYTIVREKDGRWREFSAFFTAVGFAVLTALISQIYHTGGTMNEYMKLLLAVSLPLIYIFRSHLLTAACCFLIMGFLGGGGYYYYNDGLIYIMGVAPFILYYLFFRNIRDAKTVWTRYICLVPAVYLLIYSARYGDLKMELFATAALLYTAGLFYGETGINGWKNPWLVCGWLFLTGLLTLSSTSKYFLLPYRAGEMSVLYIMGWYWLIPFLAGAYITARKLTPLKVIVMLAPLLPALCHQMRNMPDAAIWVANGYFLLVGAAALAEGARGRGLVKVNAGMLQIALLAGIRFYDSRMSILTRALAFIAVGVAFIAINIYMGRKFKSEKMLPVAEGEVRGDVEK